MSTLYLLIPIGLAFLVLAIKLLFWAINSGQYDDLDMEGHRILFDDENSPQTSKEHRKSNESSSDGNSQANKLMDEKQSDSEK